jgi:hypothetical protein
MTTINITVNIPSDIPKLIGFFDLCDATMKDIIFGAVLRYLDKPHPISAEYSKFTSQDRWDLARIVAVWPVAKLDDRCSIRVQTLVSAILDRWPSNPFDLLTIDSRDEDIIEIAPNSFAALLRRHASNVDVRGWLLCHPLFLLDYYAR